MGLIVTSVGKDPHKLECTGARERAVKLSIINKRTRGVDVSIARALDVFILPCLLSV